MQAEGCVPLHWRASVPHVGQTAAKDPSFELRTFNSADDTVRSMSRPTTEDLNGIAALYKLRVTIVEVYIFIFQVRLAYVCMSFAIMSACLSLSACTQGFLCVAQSNPPMGDILVAFIAVPAVFALMSYLVGEFTEVFWDILSHKHNPLVWCRSVFLALVWVLFRERADSHWVSRLGIVIFLSLLDIYPVSVAIFNGYQSGWGVGTMVTSLTRNTLFAIIVVFVFLAVSKVILRFSGHWKKVLDAKRHFEEQPLKTFFLPLTGSHGRAASILSSRPSIIFAESHSDKDESYCKKICQRFVCTCLVGIASFLAGWYTSVISLWPGLVFQVFFLISILKLLWMVFPHSYRPTYMMLVFAYAFVTVTSHQLAWFKRAEENDVGVRLELAESGPNYSAMVGFRLCAERWGNDADANSRLNIFDFLVMADSVYANECEGERSVYNKISSAVQGTILQDFKLEECQNWKTSSRYVVIDFPSAKKRVLAIRGTQIEDEVIADASMLSSVALLSAVRPIVDIDLLLELDTIRWILAHLNVQAWFGMRSDPFLPHLEKATALQKQAREDGFDLFVTGHSLGGAFAAIVGGRLGIQAVAFNPPGQKLMLKRFGLTNDAQLQMYLTVVQPDKDLVPLIDYQVGTIHQIPCAASCELGKCYAQCHQLAVEICQLYSVCRDPRRRVLTGELREYCEAIRIPV